MSSNQKTVDKQNIKIARIEERIKAIEDKIDKILNNDLEHLRKSINALQALVIASILVPILMFVIGK